MKSISSVSIAVAVGLILYMTLKAFSPYDDTDNEKERERSGLLLRTDHGTGCQYLVTPGLFLVGGITPRLDANGQHICVNY